MKQTNPTPELLRKRNNGILILLAGLLLLTMLLSFTLGRYPVPLRELCGILWHQIAGLFHVETEVFWTGQMQAAVWNIRLPRVMLKLESPIKMARAAPKPAPAEAPSTSGEAMGF